MRNTVNVVPADLLNGDSEFAGGPVTDAIFQGSWNERDEEIDREQIRFEMNYSFNAFEGNENL